ncbi:hypothetical protein H4582DRAFT_681946 [Lactarius indigo]|nr:hypothetical protein H4582DRAFT_681946 [Lactarius indigo]
MKSSWPCMLTTSPGHTHAAIAHFRLQCNCRDAWPPCGSDQRIMTFGPHSSKHGSKLVPVWAVVAYIAHSISDKWPNRDDMSHESPPESVGRRPDGAKAQTQRLRPAASASGMWEVERTLGVLRDATQKHLVTTLKEVIKLSIPFVFVLLRTRDRPDHVKVSYETRGHESGEGNLYSLSVTRVPEEKPFI